MVKGGPTGPSASEPRSGALRVEQRGATARSYTSTLAPGHSCDTHLWSRCRARSPHRHLLCRLHHRHRGCPLTSSPARTCVPTFRIRPSACTITDSPEPLPGSRVRGSTRVAAGFLTLNVAAALLGIVTGVIAARRLLPAGRGEMAAILVPLGLAPLVFSLGLPTFASRSAARGVAASDLVSTVGRLAAGLGVAAILPCLLLAVQLAHGNLTVLGPLLAGVALLPISLSGAVVSDIALGRQRWRALLVQRAIPPVGTAAAYIILLLTGEFTVLTAAIATVAFSLLSSIPIWHSVGRIAINRFSPDLAREALRFGTKAWPVTLSQILNHRLDQLIMIRAVPPDQLGLYAVAVTVSGATGLISSAIATATYPRIAAGGDMLVVRTVRITITICTLFAALLALVVPVAVPWAFGDAFREAVPMTLALIAASIPLAAASVLASALAGGNRPGAAGFGEIAACTITVGGLLALLPSLGAIGAAYVSIAAYSVNFAWLLVVGHHRFGGRWQDYAVPRLDDLRALGGLIPLMFKRG